MSTYAIGDIQGCYDDLRRLLDTINYDPAEDILWSVGDIVNRGPQSLEVLRFFYDLGDRAIVVLGNHELHLLNVAYARPDCMRPSDTLTDILEAPDREELLTWVRHRPFLHHDRHLGFTLVHAGFPPQWDLRQACSCAEEVEDLLRNRDYVDFLQEMYGDMPTRWSRNIQGWARARFITSCFTRLRYCTAEGDLAMKNKSKPQLSSQPYHYLIDDERPWFSVAQRASQPLNIVFGHWATLGFHMDERNGIYALDSGCLWGGALTAMRLEDRQIYQIDCQTKRAVGSC